MTSPAELFGVEEDLCAELAECLGDSPIGPVIKHPLVFCIPHLPQLNAVANAQLRLKREAVARAAAAGDWSHYLAMYERPFRVTAFAAVCERLDDDTYWEELGALWTDAEANFEHHALWMRLLTNPARRGTRMKIMTSAERAALRDLPPRLPVYRGFSVSTAQFGMSWTLDIARARWFARRFDGHAGTPMLASGHVDRADVIAHFLRRGEQEVLVAASAVQDMTVRPA